MLYRVFPCSVELAAETQCVRWRPGMPNAEMGTCGTGVRVRRRRRRAGGLRENSRLRGLLGMDERPPDGHAVAWSPTLLPSGIRGRVWDARSSNASKLELYQSLRDCRRERRSRPPGKFAGCRRASATPVGSRFAMVVSLGNSRQVRDASPTTGTGIAWRIRSQQARVEFAVASSSRASIACFGTTRRRPRRRCGISPRATSSYAWAREMPKRRPASATVHTRFLILRCCVHPMHLHLP